MKHEQLLVQYGMVRAAGMRMMGAETELREKQQELTQLRSTADGESSRLKRRLRQAYLELEARALEIAALREKVKALEMLTRNEVTNETIEKRFHDVVTQARRVERLESGRPHRSRPPSHRGPERRNH